MALLYFALGYNILANVGFDGRTHKEPAFIKSCFDAKCVHWNDTDGNRIEAHGAGMVQVRRQYSILWYSQHRSTLSQPKISITARLVTWGWTMVLVRRVKKESATKYCGSQSLQACVIFEIDTIINCGIHRLSMHKNAGRSKAINAIVTLKPDEWSNTQILVVCVKSDGDIFRKVTLNCTNMSFALRFYTSSAPDLAGPWKFEGQVRMLTRFHIFICIAINTHSMIIPCLIS